MGPPRVGDLLPQTTRPVGVRRKLATYSLDPRHEIGGPKARGFEIILGITIDSIDYLEKEIRAGILRAAITGVRVNPPHGVNCVVDLRLRGIGDRRNRIATVRTAWVLPTPAGPPRLTSAYIKF